MKETVKVVRCKDCIYAVPTFDDYWCSRIPEVSITVKASDFCSRAKKKPVK